jgi:hypothetical protein
MIRKRKKNGLKNNPTRPLAFALAFALFFIRRRTDLDQQY